MKLLKKKTKAEIEGSAKDTVMTQQEYNNKYYSGSKNVYWHCERCSVVFEHDDVIIDRTHGNEHEPRCPQMKKLFSRNWLGMLRFWEKQCKHRLTCAEWDYWQKNYHVSAPSASLPH